MRHVLAIAPLALAFAPAAAAQVDHSAHQQQPPSSAQAHDHAGHTATEPAPPAARGQSAADLPIGSNAPPAPASEALADAIWGRDAMERSRGVLRREHGGMASWAVIADVAEARFAEHETGYAFEGEAWYGTDEHRLVLKADVHGAEDDVEEAEIQALYSRPIGVYTDLQIGLEQAIEPHAETSAVLGVETLMPYWLHAGAEARVAESGRVSAELEADYTLRLTQRLVLRPRASLELSASDEPAEGVGSGLTEAEFGLRLGYEIRREFAPYVGVVWERKFGDTADYARATGEDDEIASVVAGLRAWY
jgi:copper resistance protein B